MSSKQKVSRHPGESLSVCADCGARVVVPPTAGLPPFISHETDCGRFGWPVKEAIAYEDGLTATVDNWPNGIDHRTGRDIAERNAPIAAEAFETIAHLALEGARRGVGGTLLDEEPVIVVTVAWCAPNGDPYAIGSAIPDHHDHPLLADSLRQSAEEAEEVRS